MAISLELRRNEAMSATTKRVAWFGAAIMLTAAMFLSWFLRTNAFSRILALAESYNVSTTRILANGLRGDIRQLLDAERRTELEQQQANAMAAAFHATVARQLAGLAIAKVKIYSPRGITAFSSEAKQIGEDKSLNAGFLAALSGRIASELTFRNQFSAFDVVIEDRNLPPSYTAIRQENTGSVARVPGCGVGAVGK